MLITKFAFIFVLIALPAIPVHPEEGSLPAPEYSNECLNQKHEMTGLELQCLPLLSKNGDVDGIYVYYINSSNQELQLRSGNFLPLGFRVSVHGADLKGPQSSGTTSGEKTIYCPPLKFIAGVSPANRTYSISLKPNEMLGTRIIFDTSAKVALQKMATWRVHVSVISLFYVHTVNGEQKLEPVRMSLRRVFYNQKDAKTLLANTCYQKPFMLGHPDEDDGETKPEGPDAQEPGETPTKGQ